MRLEELEEALRALGPEELGPALDVIDDLTVSLRTELLCDHKPDILDPGKCVRCGAPRTDEKDGYGVAPQRCPRC